MTEITESHLRTDARRHIIDPVAFFIALFGAPLLVTASTFWLVVPVFALLFGGPVYLAVGTPVLLWRLQRSLDRLGDLVLLAIETVIVIVLAGIAYFLLTSQQENALRLLVLGLFAVVFAALWTATFGWLYRKLCRDFYTHPVPN